ncbi:MAG: four helix bundle protein [Candidatus Kapaibacterium sp.]
MGESIVKNKSFHFAVSVVNLYKLIQSERKEFVMSKQLLRSGTSIGANVREAINAQSSADFVHKLAIAQKECDETIYWLELLKETGFIKESEFSSMNNEATKLLKIIRSIILTTKQKTQNSTLKTQHSPLLTQNSKLITHNS